MFKYDLYLAGPFFNDAQIETIAAVEKFLEENHISFYSPRRSGIVFKDLNKEQREAAANKVFQDNVDNIDASKFMLACIDDRDTGTSFELGYQYGKRDIPNIITYSGYGFGANVMLSQCTSLHIDNLYALFKFLPLYRDTAYDVKYIHEIKKNLDIRELETVE